MLADLTKSIRKHREVCRLQDSIKAKLLALTKKVDPGKYQLLEGMATPLVGAYLMDQFPMFQDWFRTFDNADLDDEDYLRTIIVTWRKDLREQSLFYIPAEVEAFELDELKMVYTEVRDIYLALIAIKRLHG